MSLEASPTAGGENKAEKPDTALFPHQSKMPARPKHQTSEVALNPKDNTKFLRKTETRKITQRQEKGQIQEKRFMVRKRPTTFRETQMMQTTTRKEHETLTLTNTARRAEWTHRDAEINNDTVSDSETLLLEIYFPDALNRDIYYNNQKESLNTHLQEAG